MSALTILRTYAQKADPASIPSSVLFEHTAKSITIIDAYPKSRFHFLILPRASAYPPLTVSNLANLRSLLKCDKDRAKEVLTDLSEDAKRIRTCIEEEMVKRFGFKWAIWTGFHSVPSMEHLHLHVISADLCSPSMKVKKHYNSFHPKLGFFLSLDDVLSWFDATPSYFQTVSQLKKTEYEPYLKEDLSCFHCSESFKNMPKLKEHLQEEWNKMSKREKSKLERKRKRETEENENTNSNAENDPVPPLKKPEQEEDLSTK
ncbi:hypothetical protein NLI96_g4134 [Meripilus lineatus]|uniref:Aprataxin C2HE/C2H2/C2HC zinc finger domain-containing protein n=1 Tax=Meripilus lineatus TaxID=2056292 RepID=A0AAD5YF29_9APHY|nr:hypothetical protein NLI96_g4134 [Physisporinus lineatus]